MHWLAEEGIVQSGIVGPSDEKDDADVVELVEGLRDLLRVTRARVIRRRASETGEGGQKERSKGESIAKAYRSRVVVRNIWERIDEEERSVCWTQRVQAEEMREHEVLVGIDEERNGYYGAEKMCEDVDALSVWFAEERPPTLAPGASQPRIA